MWARLITPAAWGTVGNAKCGDIMRIFLDIDENQVVRDAKFKTFGCGAGDCDQLDGYGDDYWQDNSGGAGSDQQGSHGSAGRSAAGQGALLPSGRAGGAWAALWDYAQKNNITIEGLKPPVNDVDELEEAHEGEA